MTNSRSAALTLIACFAVCGPTRGSQITGSTVDRAVIVVSQHSGSETGLVRNDRTSRASTYSRFTPWRTRQKSVLKESDYEIVEERLFGRAILPCRLIMSARVDLVSRPLATRPPLRC
jgi:hypothetical protein